MAYYLIHKILNEIPQNLRIIDTNNEKEKEIKNHLLNNNEV